jgi:very-short-patch-repair endonuclease
MSKISNCKFCNETFDSKSVGGHTKFCDMNPARFSHLENLKSTRNSITEDSRMIMKDGVRKAWKRGAYADMTQSRIGKSGAPHSEETKKKLSNSRKAWLSTNPEKHPWKRSSKFDSEPCQKLKDALRMRSIEFLEEFTPLQERFFSIDIAIPALKLGIEVNGEQHYNRDGTLKTYYRERHELIEKDGWKLYEIHYSHCYDSSKIEQIVTSLIEKHDLQNVDLTFEVKKISKQETRKFPTRQDYADSQKLSQEMIQQWKAAIDLVDTTKFGFVVKLAKEMGCSHTHVRRVLKKYFPDVQSYKRKSRGP